MIILTSSLRQFRLDNEVCCGLQKLVRPMILQGCCKADRAEVVERDRFATPNSLKSHGERNLLSPVSNTCAITPKLWHAFEAQYTLRKITWHSNHVPRLNPHSARGTIACHFPRFRSLKAFGRRPRCKPHRRDRPASETLNTNGLMRCNKFAEIHLRK